MSEDRNDFGLPNIEASDSSSVSSLIDASINKPMPYIWFNGVLSALGLGLSVSAIIIALVIHARSTISENHWRNFEVEQKAMRIELTRLEDQENARNKSQ